MIGEGLIVITVVGIKEGQVKIGVDAPEQMRVDREEIHELRKRLKAEAEAEEAARDA